MSMKNGAEVLHKAAGEFLSLLAAHDGDPSRDPDGVASAVEGLADHYEEYFQRGLMHSGRRILSTSRVIYFAPDIRFNLSRGDRGPLQEAHDHGCWVGLVPCKGGIHFQSYGRRDDEATEGHAELELMEDRELTVGDVGIVGPPPNDIHATSLLADDTWFITLLPGPVNPMRRYFDPSNGSYYVKDLQA